MVLSKSARRLAAVGLRVAILVWGTAISTGALAQKCVQSGATAEEGAIECVPAVITRVNHDGPTGITSEQPWCPDNVHDERAVEQCLLNRMASFRACFVRHDMDRDWYYGGPWGDTGREQMRLMYKEYRSYFGTTRWSDAGAMYCDTSAAYLGHIHWAVRKFLWAQCPPGKLYMTWWYESDGGDGSPMCGNPKRQQCLRPGNPIEMATGAKLLSESHVTLDPSTGLQLAWHYNSARQSHLISQPSGASPLIGTSASPHPLAQADRVWRHGFDKQLFHTPTGRRPSVRIVRPESTEDVFFVQEGGQWRRTATMGQDGLIESPTTPASRWFYRTPDNVVEVYNSAGQLVQTQQPDGRRIDLVYVNGRLERVRNVFGHFIRFEYDTAGLMSAAVTSAGNRYTYAFDPAFRTLQSVTFPGNAVRRYLYEGAFKHLLTGVNGELGRRLSTYAYDTSQRATMTERAGGVDRFTVTHNVWPGPGVPGGSPATITGPTGATANVFWRELGPRLRWDYYTPVRESLAGLSAPVPGMAGTWQASENDANGNVTMRRGFDNVVTRSSFDLARNLETRRIANADTASAQTQDTQWHPDWNLPARTAAPGVLTTTLFNGQLHNGQTVSCAPASLLLAGKPMPLPCWVIEQPTADANGSQGFNAAPSGNATITRATYNANGQVLLHERYDNVTPAAAATPTALPGMQAPTLRRTYAYAAASDANFTRGDLQTLAQEWPSQSPPPAAQTTTFRKYNKRGQVLEFQSPDSSVSTLTYHARGWLTQYSVLPAGGNLQTTRYAYDAAGQLSRATLPDGSFVSFTHDDAQRLTGIRDSAGNSETYVFDNASNRSLQRAGAIDALMRNLGRALFPSVPPPPGPTAIAEAPASRTLLAAWGARDATEHPLTLSDPGVPVARSLNDIILAQVPPPPPRGLPYSPGWSPPAAPLADPDLWMERFDRDQISLRSRVERWLRECQCPPDGGFGKPTLTAVSWAHLWITGHLSPMWSNKSYFTEPVSQAFLDEVLSRNPERSELGDRVRFYVGDMGRFVGNSPSGGGNFESRRDVTVIVHQTNCSYLPGRRPRNEVITMYPGRPNLAE